jgi:hypothetical protein
MGLERLSLSPLPPEGLHDLVLGSRGVYVSVCTEVRKVTQ